MKTGTTIVALSLLFFLTFQCGSQQGTLVVDPNYQSNCSSCHGADLKGLTLGPSLLTENLKYGNTVENIAKGISKGYPESGMPQFAGVLTEDQIKNLAIWIGEKRANTSYADYKIKKPLVIPAGIIKSEEHDFRIEVLTKGLGQWPFSIEPLPNGSFLLTEKQRGLSIISTDGKQSDLIQGTPKVYDDGAFEPTGLMHGLGWMLEVAIHPEYEENGWIYMTFGDRCEDCNAESRYIKRPVSLCKLVRGRIQDGQWVDQETIWESDIETYTAVPETSTGGRITFDEANHLFFSLGAKKYTPKPPGNFESYLGIQDLSQPYGKIYRINDDGSLPEDNPFINHPSALKSIWTYGHRSPQGLEYNPESKQLWGTEMGPRGGDEVNLLKAGRNYGWPLVSKGMDYDGTEVEYGKHLGIDVDAIEIEAPKVDMTPSPAVSSFVFYKGDQFPNWQNNLIVGSLKAATLYRFVLEGEEVVKEEILLKDLARIRDIEVGNDGLIYLLLEHKSGGQLVRLVPQ